MAADERNRGADEEIVDAADEEFDEDELDDEELDEEDEADEPK